MPRPSKVYGSGFEEEVIRLHTQDYSHNRIADELKARGFNISGRAIGRFLSGQGYESKGQSVTYDKTLQSGVCKTKDEQVLNPTLIDVSEVFEELGINTDFSDVDNVVDGCQKISASIFMKMAAILDKKLDMYAEGLCKYPNEEARGYRIGGEAIATMWGYQQLVNTAQAIKTLENQGYQIEGRKQTEKKPEP
jgi:hypothetical protein